MKEKGFTLIELLAVIVILAIIALIATPIVLDIIDDTKKSAQLRSAENYLKAAEMAVAKKMMDDATFKPTECSVEDGNLKCGDTRVDVLVSGEKPSGGTLTFVSGSITGVELVLNGKTIIREDGELVYEVQLESGLYDAEGNLIASWDELVNEYGLYLGNDYGVDLKIDFEPEYDKYGDLINREKVAGVVLSNDEKLKQGTKLVIDNSLTEIGAYAFLYCTSLEEVIIPDSVTSIGESAFEGCTSLKEINLPNNITSIGEDTFKYCENLTKVIIGNSVTSIGEGSFLSCESLTEIIIPNGVMSIGDQAFDGCESLTGVTIPDSVVSIGESAFEGCTSLKEINLPNNITSIGEGTFKYCENLTEVVIPNSVINIGGWAFAYCEKLKTINYIGTLEQWNSIVKGDKWSNGMPNDYTVKYN